MPTRYALVFLLIVLAVTARPSLAAEDFRPAIIYESETTGDKSFIEMMRRGAQKANAELGIEYQEFRMEENSDRKQFIDQVASSGVTHILAVGFQNVLAVAELAEKFPEIKFTVIDGIVPPFYRNVQSIVFKDNEGAYLVGIIAAMRSTTGRIGFIGGMESPLINNFELGYTLGARYANLKIEVLSDMVGTTQAAWSNPGKAKALAKKQFNDGAGVIFAAAGGSSVGVLEAADEMGRFAIGVDTNQNGLYPGTVLTSMIKRVDMAVYETLLNSFRGKWEPGIKSLGIRENALDYSVDVYNKDLITTRVIDAVEDAKDRIERGLIVVDQYEPY